MPDLADLPEGLIRAMHDAGLTDADRQQVTMYAEFLHLAPTLGQEEAYKRAYRTELW